MNFYEINFITKKGGEKRWVIHIEAKNLKEAKEKMLHLWATDRRFSGMHAFQIEARRFKDTEEFKFHYFALKAN